MTVTDLDLINLNLAIYALPGAPAISWDHFNPGTDLAGICWGVKRFAVIDCIVLRGSTTFEDWIRDFEHFALAANEPSLGRVHPGFYDGMPQTWGRIKPLVGARTIVTGHSLGAARADVLTALMTLDGVPPLARVVFGEPKPGLPHFADLIASIPARPYVNCGSSGHDLVTDVPFTFPPEDYVRPTPLMAVSEAPTPADDWGPFAWHHAELYAGGVAKLNPMPAVG